MDLITKTARQIVDDLRAGRVSCVEVLDAVAERVAAVDPAVNALPTLCLERARDRATDFDRTTPEDRGVLAGLPIVIKDLSDVAGVRSTQGSPIFSDAVPKTSTHVVDTIEANGGVVFAKSNTPEFGAGGNTFNDLFGATVNPWNTKLSAAGSSGGSAVALATGMAWLAHGSDMGGSLRNPASFCGVVGLRPSPGRVSSGPSANPYDTLSTDGPMARDVDDLALFLDAMSDFDPREPLSLPRPAVSFQDVAAARRKPKRVAFSADLGITPVDPVVAEICRRSAKRFEALGVPVEEAHPNFSGAHEAFQVLRAHSFATGMNALLENHRDALKPEVIWNIEKGLALTSAEIGEAERMRGCLVARTVEFFETYDLLLTPATIVAPYPIEDRYVHSCNGQAFDTYIDWLAIAYAITLVSLPALSLPCGFTPDGLPVGLQMVGKPRGEAELLSASGVLQDALGLNHLPIDPIVG